MIEREKVGNNDTLNAIFEDLYNLLSEANRIPLTDKIIVEESDISGILEDLREAIPREVRNAGKVLEDQHNIVTAAQEEASAIVEKAKTEAEHIVTAAKEEAERILRQETVVQQAEALAKDIKTNAMRHSDQVRADADAYSDQLRQDSLKYADEMLAYLERRCRAIWNRPWAPCGRTAGISGRSRKTGRDYPGPDAQYAGLPGRRPGDGRRGAGGRRRGTGRITPARPGPYQGPEKRRWKRP